MAPEICGQIFVFNEDFIDENIKVAGGLRSIIRIGTSAELDAPIRDANQKIQGLKEKQEPIKESQRILNAGPTVVGSIREAEKEFKNGLKKPGGYVERLDRIEGRQHNLVVGLYQPVLDHDKNDVLPVSISDAGKKLDETIERYRSLQSGSPVVWRQPNPGCVLDFAEINGLVTKTVRPAELTDEERMILEELSTELASEDFISKTQNLVIDSSRGFCPLCHQPVSADHKHTLEERLVRYRDKTVQEFKEKVDDVLQGIRNLDMTLPSFPSVEYDGDLQEAERKLAEVNDFISTVKEVLKRKAANPFSRMDSFDQAEFDTLVEECRACLSRVSGDVEAYNRILAEKDTLRGEIDRMNVRLAYHENKYWIDEFNDRTAEEAKLREQFSDLEEKIRKQTELVTSLKSRIDQVDEARDQINCYLDIIFGINKLRLATAGKDSYKLQIKKNDTYVDIPPKAISSGERNALALAYFFACVLEKKDKNYDYGEPTFLVIDDPVSSFDADNKAGVISLIASQSRKVLNGNPESKVLVLTHDYTTLRDLCNLRRNSIAPYDYETGPGGRGSYWYYGCLSANRPFRRVNCKSVLENMEYGSDLLDIFEFAEMPDPDSYEGLDGIGNTIRRFAESYATHMYKCRWFDLFSDDVRLKCIPDRCIESIRTFAVRNVLNSESHGTVDGYSPAEIQRSARVLVTYIFYADRNHLRAYLAEKYPGNEWVDDVKGWFR